MADKEIIIDGVDVSEWTDEEVRYKFEKHSPKAIKQIAFDLYKQLKRKEQECEELKEDRERWKSNFNGKVSAIEELLQQLDQFKAKEQEVKRYKQALDEIEKYLDAQQKYFDGEDYHNLLDIINKVKGEIDEES